MSEDKIVSVSIPLTAEQMLHADEIKAYVDAKLQEAFRKMMAEYTREQDHLLLYGDPSAPQPRGLLNMRRH